MISKSSEERPGLCVPELPIGTSSCYLAFYFIAEAVRKKIKQLHQDFSEVKTFDTTRRKRGLLSQFILSHCHHCSNNKGSHAHFLSVYYVQSKALCSEVRALKPVCFDTSAGEREKGKGTFGLGDPRKVF